VDDDSQREEQAAKECKAFIFTNFVRDDRPGLKEADVKWLLGALPRI
jgi:hypothetical protein